MRILFVTARPPLPSRRGDQARAAGWLEALRPRHELHVLALDPPGFRPAALPAGVGGRSIAHGRGAMLAGLRRAGRWPLQVALHHAPALRHAFTTALEELRPDVVVPILSRVGWIAEHAGGLPVVVDLVDSLTLNLRERARRQPLARPLLLWEARRMLAWDRRQARVAAAASVVSARDRAVLIEGAPELAAKIEIVPFGLALGAGLPRSEPGGEVVLVSGNLGYFPTVDGVRWFAREIWPRLRRERPGCEWWLAGSRPSRALRRLARLPGVRLIADPADLGALRRRAAVAVAPLRSGSGTAIKILEAMADGVPVVTTSRGARGLDGLPRDALAIADEPADFAAAAARLLAEPSARRRQAEQAWVWLRSRHDLTIVATRFEELLLRAVSG